LNRVRHIPERVAARREQLDVLKRRVRHPLWWLPDPAVQQEEAYRRIWQNLRVVQDVRDGRHDTQEWRARQGPFAMCCVRVPPSCFTPELDSLRTVLESFPYVRLHPESFLHIPIQEIGFLSDSPVQRNDLTRKGLDEFIAQAHRPLLDFPSFPIVLGPVNSFADAAFLDIDDDGWLSRIHRRLLDFAPVPPSTRYPYLPHLTLAHYDRVAPIGNLPAALAEWRDLPLGEFVVDQIDVVLLDTQETFPPFDVVHEFMLGTTRATGAFPRSPDPRFD
jgi:2'-5' RNA ligase